MGEKTEYDVLKCNCSHLFVTLLCWQISTSVHLMVSRLSIHIMRMIAMMMPTVQIPRVRISVRVTLVTVETE